MKIVRAIISTAALLCSQVGFADVRDEGKIDVIAAKPDSPRVLLLMFQSSSWEGKVPELLSRKIDTYREFVGSGQLVSSRPHLAGRKVRIALLYQQLPPAEIATFLENAKSRLALDGIDFVWGEKSEAVKLGDTP
ncbi:DUF6572 domain-containing protein [Undibacterium sp. Xuan67W]|uniref:DUF6572 domain-containing protein n=1 Tax=Undibacterium sp. Xuan67W TaxID=3413057 RepID=UPI003BF26471